MKWTLFICSMLLFSACNQQKEKPAEPLPVVSAPAPEPGEPKPEDLAKQYVEKSQQSHAAVESLGKE